MGVKGVKGRWFFHGCQPSSAITGKKVQKVTGKGLKGWGKK
jgi:hypothetical protein